MLWAEQLGKKFDSRWIFRGIDLRVDKGQILALLGPNGSGKTTLMRCLAGLETPTQGSVVFSTGRDIRLSLGYAALDLALYPHLSAEEHLNLAGELRGIPSKSKDLVEQVGLHLIESNQVVSTFSSGMRARLRVALAIQSDPDILFLDEPGASLDESGHGLIHEIIHTQIQRGAVVIATNDSNERRLATHELVLS